jgi:hypothetical protein
MRQAHRTPLAAPGRFRLAARLRSRCLVRLLGAAALLGACSPSFTLERPAPLALLPAEVDSIVVRPFDRAANVQMNDADLALLPRHLRDALTARERLRGYDQPPTVLPNTVVLTGRLERYAVRERRGEGLTLRTIDLEAELRVLDAKGETAGAVLRQSVSWQKVYAGTPVSALELDLEDAVRELAGQFAQALAPEPGGPVQLRSGSRTALVGGHPTLIKGNRFAVARRFRQAQLSWLRVLFDPIPASNPMGYRVDAATLNRLRAAGVSDALLERLGPLVGESPLPLVAFRARLRAAAGETLPNEGLILTLADLRTGIAHENLTAAHANLAAVYEIEGRVDVAAYHWARAWAHDPTPALLERWHTLQAQRKVLPRGLTEQQALELYLRIPPPETARVVPGAFERTVLPPPAFPPEETHVAAAPGGASGAAPASAPGAVSPGAPGAVPAAAPATAVPAATDSTPGGAAGSGPRGTGGPPSEAVTPGAAPSEAPPASAPPAR